MNFWGEKALENCVKMTYTTLVDQNNCKFRNDFRSRIRGKKRSQIMSETRCRIMSRSRNRSRGRGRSRSRGLPWPVFPVVGN